MSSTSNAVLKGAIAGLAAGLVASVAMEAAQRLMQGDDEGEPATQKAADKASRKVRGKAIATKDKAKAGEAVHYLTGAGLGVAYGIAAEFMPEVTRGAGTAFSTAVAGVLDEGIVPALGLGAAPWKAAGQDHAKSLSSHLVYGLVAEATRRAARVMLDRALP